MSFQAYIDNIEKKTGRKASDIVAMVKATGLTKHTDMVNWLKAELELGHGHANAIMALIRGKRPD